MNIWDLEVVGYVFFMFKLNRSLVCHVYSAANDLHSVC